MPSSDEVADQGRSVRPSGERASAASFERQRHPAPAVIAVSGIAGSGKSTLGRALAQRLRLPLLDLDTISNPLLDSIPEELLSGHWLSSRHGDAIRAGRYAALRAVAKDVVGTARGCVLVAPFTRELAGRIEWEALSRAVGGSIAMLQLVGDAHLFENRRGNRAAQRDRHRPPDESAIEPLIPVITIDADLTRGQQLSRALIALGYRTLLSDSASLFASPFDAVLFDLDGTLVDSTASVLRSWRRFATEFDLTTDQLHANHGQTARTLLESLLLPSDVERGLMRIEDLETADAPTVTPALGAHALFAGVPETARAIVTSGSRRVASARLKAAAMPIDGNALVTADDVKRGKPDPAPFLLGAERVNADPRRCLAVEDAVAGVYAAKQAGCMVLAVAGTVLAAELAVAGADLVVDALDRVTISSNAGRLTLQPTATKASRTPDESPGR